MMDFLYELYELDATSVSWIMIDLMSCVFIASGSLLLIRFGFLLIESLYLLSVFLWQGYLAQECCCANQCLVHINQ